MEAVFCSVQREGEIECYASQVLTLVLTTTIVCPKYTENKYILCTHLGALGPIQPS